ncbi:MAG: alpha/beta fold family hydrolase [Gammaproteobacteria bacterium]|nr:alpha/beta fold family hydrolase [Gammaproteobacteria bacterium]
MVKGIVSSRPVEAEPRVRRGYFESRYGQLHVHNAIPPGGGFEEGTPLLCLHKNPLSGRLFERFLALAGRDRSVYAPDIPGFGESDPPPSRPTLVEYAAGIGDFLDAMRFRQIDVLGYHAGALIAAELAILRPKQVRRVVLTSVPVLTEAERESIKRAYAPTQPVPDGSHLALEWQRTVDAYGPGAPLELVTQSFVERLRNGVHAAWLAHAALQYPVRERLSLITQPVLLLRPRDDLWEATLRARELLPKARCVDFQEQGQGLFQAAPELVADAIREFLRG